jgi:hypothetical protein
MLAHTYPIVFGQGGNPAASDVSASSSARSGRALRATFVALLLAITVGQRLGLNFGSYSLNLALPAMYGLLLIAILSGALLLSLKRLLLYGACVAVALLSTMVNASRASIASLLLLFVMYLPFLFVLRADALGQHGARWPLRVFSNIALACAIAGIVQFYAQFICHADWLFDFTGYLPAMLRGPSGFNTVIAVGSLHKSNGFFFREPSGFSFIMALGLLAEWAHERRLWRVGCFGLALLLSYSGTGLLALFIGLLFPLGPKTLVRLALLAGVGGAALWLLGDALNLSFTLSRLGEFGAERSSAYIRYVAPMRLVRDSFETNALTPWLGHGPGTISHAKPGYEFHDPTWAKLLFEYGVLGFTAFLALFLTTLARPALAVQLRATLFFAWLLMGGHLLSPEQNFLMLALVALVPLAGTRLERTTPLPNLGLTVT